MLNSEYAVAFVRGLQGSHPEFVRVASTLKHFVAYDAPENNPSREGFDAVVGKQDLADSAGAPCSCRRELGGWGAYWAIRTICGRHAKEGMQGHAAAVESPGRVFETFTIARA